MYHSHVGMHSGRLVRTLDCWLDRNYCNCVVAIRCYCKNAAHIVKFHIGILLYHTAFIVSKHYTHVTHTFKICYHRYRYVHTFLLSYHQHTWVSMSVCKHVFSLYVWALERLRKFACRCVCSRFLYRRRIFVSVYVRSTQLIRTVKNMIIIDLKIDKLLPM